MFLKGKTDAVTSLDPNSEAALLLSDAAAQRLKLSVRL